AAFMAYAYWASRHMFHADILGSSPTAGKNGHLNGSAVLVGGEDDTEIAEMPMRSDWFSVLAVLAPTNALGFHLSNGISTMRSPDSTTSPDGTAITGSNSVGVESHLSLLSLGNKNQMLSIKLSILNITTVDLDGRRAAIERLRSNLKQ